MWCEQRRVASIIDIEPLHVGAYVELLMHLHSAPIAKRRLAATRMLFDWLVTRQIVATNPAASVRSPRTSAKRQESFRAARITAYLKNGGTLEKASSMENHASTRPTRLYHRRRDERNLDEVGVLIWDAF